MVIAQSAAKPLATANVRAAVLPTSGRDQFIAESLVVPLPVVVRHKLGDNVAQTSLSEENESIEALFTDRPHEPLRVSVGIRRLKRRLHDAHASAFDEAPESLRPLRVPVADQNPISAEGAVDCVGKIARRLSHEGVVRVRRRASHMHAPRPQVQREQRVVRHQPTRSPHFYRV